MTRRKESEYLVDGDNLPSTSASLAQYARQPSNRNRGGNRFFRPLEHGDLPDSESDAYGETHTDSAPASVHGGTPQPVANSAVEGNAPNGYTVSEHESRSSPMDGSYTMNNVNILCNGTSVSAINRSDGNSSQSFESITARYLELFQGRLLNLYHAGEKAGSFEGEIAFSFHPNMDVSAYQWSHAASRWDNIGQYSHKEGVIKGLLSSTQLQDSPFRRDSIEYFKAIAEHKERGQRPNAVADNNVGRSGSMDFGFKFPENKAVETESRRSSGQNQPDGENAQATRDDAFVSVVIRADGIKYNYSTNHRAKGPSPVPRRDGMSTAPRAVAVSPNSPILAPTPLRPQTIRARTVANPNGAYGTSSTLRGGAQPYNYNPAANLRISEPDAPAPLPVYMQHREEIVTVTGKPEVAPRNFQGPFFMGCMPTTQSPATSLASPLDEETKLWQWYHNRPSVDLQQDMSNAYMEQATKPRGALEREDVVNTPLFVRLLRNLEEYRDDSREGRGSYFTKGWRAPSGPDTGL